MSRNIFYLTWTLQRYELYKYKNLFVCIEGGAFSDCSKLSSLTIGSGVETVEGAAFQNCEELKDVYCLAADVPHNDSYVSPFTNYYINLNATLHVPASSLEAYKADKHWNGFKNIVALTNEDLGIPKCEIPTINYEYGTLQFNCATEGAECVSTITDKDITSYIGNTIELGATYNISVYAFKEGYQNSDVATATLCWIDVEPKTEGIENSGVAEVHANAVLIQSNNGVVTISGVNSGTEIAIYSADGRMQGSKKANDNTTSFSTNLNKGEIAIVKIGDKSVKVVMQ